MTMYDPDNPRHPDNIRKREAFLAGRRPMPEEAVERAHDQRASEADEQP